MKIDTKKFSDDFKDLLTTERMDPMVVSHYHSPGSSDKNVDALFLLDQEKLFRDGTLHVLFSTCALGLGYDNNKISHVVHMWTPNSLVQYYQEIGRAGRTRTGEDAVAHLLPTEPWNPTGWVAVLSSICWYLAREPEKRAPAKAVKDRGNSLGHKETDIERAIVLGLEKSILESSAGGEILQLRNMNESLESIDKLYAEHMRGEVEIMARLSHNCGKDILCIWQFIMSQFECQRNDVFTCNKCSGLKCSAGNDIDPNSFSEGNYFYKTISLQENVPIISFIHLLVKTHEKPELL
jgi:hypothetical protein